MKKLTLLALAAIISFSALAANPTTKELASVDAIILSKVSDLEQKVESQEKLIELQSGAIDSLVSLGGDVLNKAKEPVESKDDMKDLLGAILGFLTFLVQNILLRIKSVKDWVDTKFSNSSLAIALGLLATGITFFIVSAKGDVATATIFKWLVGAWGTHFAIYVSMVKKVAKSVE